MLFSDELPKCARAGRVDSLFVDCANDAEVARLKAFPAGLLSILCQTGLMRRAR